MNNSPNVLVIAQSLIPSVIVGIVKPLEVLAKKHIINFSFIESHKVTSNHLTCTDILICVRGCTYFEVDLVRAARNKGRYIIYFLDDDLLNVPDTAASYEYYSLPRIKKNIITLLKLSNILMTPNSNIGNKYRQYCPDVRITKVPALLLDENDVRQEKDESEPIIIGFSGTIDHVWSLENYLMGPLEQILIEFRDRVRFVVMGPRPNFLERLNITYIPYETDFDAYMKTIKFSKWDVGLAPLPKSDFHASKFYNKYLEYSAIGAAGLYSKVEPFTHIIEDGVNGMLVDNSPESWVQAIKKMITNRSTRLMLAATAYNHVKANFCLGSVTEQLLEEIPELGTYQAPVAREKDFRIGIIKQPLIRKFVNLVRNHGCCTPFEIIKKVKKKIRKL